jgi:hypothetical protein
MGGHTVNRWRQRLAELRGEGNEGSPAASVHNVQNSTVKATFEHLEQIEQPENPHNPAAPSAGEAEEEGYATGRHSGDALATRRARFGLPEIPESPLMLRDGRRLWRFRAGEIRDTPRDQTAALVDQAHWHGAVLVADGRELIVVERWLSRLPRDVLCELRLCAAGVIAELLSRARARWQETAR